MIDTSHLSHKADTQDLRQRGYSGIKGLIDIEFIE